MIERGFDINDDTNRRIKVRRAVASESELAYAIFDLAAPGESTPESWATTLAELDRCELTVGRWLDKREK